MSLSVSGPSDSRRPTGPVSKKTKAPIVGSLKPTEYAKAVRGYSQLTTGAGQNHIALGEFLTSEPTSIPIEPHRSDGRFVTEYILDAADDYRSSPSRSPAPPPDTDAVDVDQDSADDRARDSRPITSFADPERFFRHTVDRVKPQSCIIFMRGFMSAAWINHIGACHMVDPEFFCRHLDFRPADDNSNNFSVPALPSSSWHLLELPIVTIGATIALKRQVRLDKVELLRQEGTKALKAHHDRVAKLSSSGMMVGESMFRDLHVLDETHFAIEQQISVCLQSDRGRKVFSLLVWLDSGTDISDRSSLPWFVQHPESRLLPTIRHRHMNALKCHLFRSPSSGDLDNLTRRDQSAAFLPEDYGRTLHPEVMSQDALYSLTEVVNFAASSQMQFCNLVDIKLDQYTSLPPEQDVENLPNLRYIKQILYDHAQKTQRILDSINSTKDQKWPKDRTSSASRKAVTAVQSLEQDFQHILQRTMTLHDRTTQAITTLLSSISITESQRAIDQAQRVGKLTFLAFFFVPLGFTSSFFGMNVSELQNGQLGVKWWLVMSIFVAGASLAVFFLDVVLYCKSAWETLMSWWKRREN